MPGSIGFKIEIVSVKDGNGNKWYETQYLAQDKVPLETPYYEDSDNSRKTDGYYKITR